MHSYVPLLSIGLFVSRKRLVCLLLRPPPLISIKLPAPVRLSAPLKDSLISPPPPSILISLMGVKLAVGLFLLFWVRVLPTERESVLLAWPTTMRTRLGFVVAEMHFLTHVNEWRLTFHSSRPFAEWQL